jgi:hypothetical protein
MPVKNKQGGRRSQRPVADSLTRRMWPILVACFATWVGDLRELGESRMHPRKIFLRGSTAAAPAYRRRAPHRQHPARRRSHRAHHLASPSPNSSPPCSTEKSRRPPPASPSTPGRSSSPRTAKKENRNDHTRHEPPLWGRARSPVRSSPARQQQNRPLGPTISFQILGWLGDVQVGYSPPVSTALTSGPTLAVCLSFFQILVVRLTRPAVFSDACNPIAAGGPSGKLHIAWRGRQRLAGTTPAFCRSASGCCATGLAAPAAARWVPAPSENLSKS